MIYDYVNTKPPLEEVYSELQHGWIQGAFTKMANKAHKYIEKYKNEKGKWVYRYYRKKSQDLEKKVSNLRDAYFVGKSEVTKDATQLPKIYKQRQAWDKSGRKKAWKQRKKYVKASTKSYLSRKKIKTANSDAKHRKNISKNYKIYQDRNKVKKNLDSYSKTRKSRYGESQKYSISHNPNRWSKDSSYWKIRKTAESARKRRKLK